MNCGLLGEKLRHSYSPLIHSIFADYPYKLFETKPVDLADFLQNSSFTGINVTIPYKKSVIPYCSSLSDRAEKLGAVNTIIRNSDGALVGHNTDYFGFLSMVNKTGLQVSGKKALILGSGGAAVTAFFVLEELGAIPVIISRSGENNYLNLHVHTDAALIINATPVGMYPNNGPSPIDIAAFPYLEAVLDLIYNPAKTQLLLDAESRGITAMNGLWMLVAQAKESAEWFLRKPLPDSLIEKAYRTILHHTQNIILIGMPGCGKTTIGCLLAERTGREFVDADLCIEEKAGKTISQIFQDDGEAVFRQLETQILSELGKRSSLVIATGGGCVTQSRNYPLLHQNGRIIWLQRDISTLPTHGRPLSQTQQLSEMYKIRQPLYAAFSDLSIPNDSTVEVAVDRIIEQEELL